MRTTPIQSTSTSSLRQITNLFLVSSLLTSISALPLARRCEMSTINYTTGACNPIRFARFLQTGSLTSTQSNSHSSESSGTLIPKYTTGLQGKLIKTIIKNESECYSACIKIGVDFQSIQYTSSSKNKNMSIINGINDEIDDSICYCKHSSSIDEGFGPLRIDFKGTVSLFEGDCITLNQNVFLKGVECEDVMITVGEDFTLLNGRRPKALI